jgi:putative hydrolase of the HAD superfamily
MADVKALFWDNGGVILTNGWDRESREKAVGKFHLDWDEFEDRHELMLNAFECGDVSLKEYLQRTVFYRERAFTPDEFRHFMFEQSQLLPDGAIGVLADIAQRGRYLQAALNNESLEINDYRVHAFHLRDYFKAFFSSCYLKVRKPHPGIYSLALKISQCEPEECVLIDDRGLNLECAREMGMHTIQYKDAGGLRRDLAALGVDAGGK